MTQGLATVSTQPPILTDRTLRLPRFADLWPVVVWGLARFTGADIMAIGARMYEH